MENPSDFLRSDIRWKGDNQEEIRPDLFGEKEVKPGQKVAIGVFGNLECFKMIVELSNVLTHIYKERIDTNLLEADNIHMLPR